MDNKSNPLDIPNYNNNYNNTIKHVCLSYPCYYCNKDVIQNFTTFSCVDKRISFISNSIDNSTSSYENDNNKNKLTTSMDSETQTSLTFVDIEKYEKLSSSLLSNINDISNNDTDNKNEDENYIFQMDTSDEEIKNLNNINYIDEYTYNSISNTYFDPENFDGYIDSLPDKVFLDIGESLSLEQSLEF